MTVTATAPGTAMEQQQQDVGLSDGMEELTTELEACSSCGRKFRPDALRRHAPICQRSKSKPKQVFDIKSKRREAIIQENNVDNAFEVFSNASSESNQCKQMSQQERQQRQSEQSKRRNSFIDPKVLKPPSKASTTPAAGAAPKRAPLERKPANAPRGGPPKPKPEPPKPPTPARSRRSTAPRATPTSSANKQPLQNATAARKAAGDATTTHGAGRSRTSSRGAPNKRGAPSPDVNGNRAEARSGHSGSVRKTPSRNPIRGAPAMRRAISSPNIDTNNNTNINNRSKEGPVVKFKEKFPHHVNANLDTFSAMLNKSHGNLGPISIRKPRTVPGVRTGGHSGVEFADPDLLKRPASSIELESGWDSKRFTEDYVLRHSPKTAPGGSMTDLRSSAGDVCSKCNSPFLVTTAKFCFNCGDKR